jgi:hypothetical protein
MMGNWQQCWGVGEGTLALGCWWDSGGCATAGLLQGKVIRSSALAHWWGGGVVTVLVQARWCWSVIGHGIGGKVIPAKMAQLAES